MRVMMSMMLFFILSARYFKNFQIYLLLLAMKHLYQTSQPPQHPLIKTPEQIEGIRRASKIAAQTLVHIKPYIQSGVSTAQLDHICNAYIVSQGAISACIDYRGHNTWGK
jgi:hypothetical protein